MKDLEKLLQEYEENKQELKKLSNDLVELTQKVSDLIPQEYNFRTRFVLEDRVKILTSLYDTVLRYKSEISKVTEKQIQIIKDVFSSDDEDLQKQISMLPTEQAKEILEKIERLITSETSK